MVVSFSDNMGYMPREILNLAGIPLYRWTLDIAIRLIRKPLHYRFAVVVEVGCNIYVE